jgi:hypothetical protein
MVLNGWWTLTQKVTGRTNWYGWNKVKHKMDFKGIEYKFTAKLWAYGGPNSWYFISLPPAFSIEIRENLKSAEEGWGRLKATAKVGLTEWKTAIWFDTKMKTYLLPLKAEIRKKERIEAGQDIHICIWV